MSHIPSHIRPFLRDAYWRAKGLRRSPPKWLTVEAGPLKGCQLYLSQDAQWSAQMIEGKYDTFIYDALERIDLKGRTVWDIGAHIGYHSLGFARIVGATGRVHSFEPLRDNFERLSEHVSHNADLTATITAHQIALSDSNGEATFTCSHDIERGRSMGGHLSAVAPPLSKNHYKTFEQESVKVACADTLVSDGTLKPPAIIKLDVEGAELSVLSGCIHTLTTHKPILLAEIHNVLMMFGVQKLLCGLGYELELLHSEPEEKSRCFVIAHPAQ